MYAGTAEVIAEDSEREFPQFRPEPRCVTRQAPPAYLHSCTLKTLMRHKQEHNYTAKWNDQKVNSEIKQLEDDKLDMLSLLFFFFSMPAVGRPED